MKKTSKGKGTRSVVPIRTHTTKTRGGSEKTAVIVNKPWTKFADLGGLSISGFTDLVLIIKRLQHHDRLACKAHSWAMYPSSDRFAWITTGGKSGTRFLGIGVAEDVTKIHTRFDETLIKLRLPLESININCGRDLAEMVGIYSYHSELQDKYGKQTGKEGRGAQRIA